REDRQGAYLLCSWYARPGNCPRPARATRRVERPVQEIATAPAGRPDNPGHPGPAPQQPPAVEVDCPGCLSQPLQRTEGRRPAAVPAALRPVRYASLPAPPSLTGQVSEWRQRRSSYSLETSSRTTRSWYRSRPC